MNSNRIELETKLVGDIKGTFCIPDYQRGYRWGKEEVMRLLNDVHSNGKQNYCLQPIVVRRRADHSYELIDGQQRLTTIYLIYHYMKNVNFFKDPAFNLIYETRNASQDFLQKIDPSRREENIDFWFIANAYDTIQKWFEEDLHLRVIHFFEYFKENVKIIWYEVGENEDSISLFTRLNIGKIPLTNAELVKAMFLSTRGKANAERERQNEISLQWDNMEKALHNDRFWYFLTNHVNTDYQTRIDLILDLISGKPENNHDKYYTFFKIDEIRSETSLNELWREIQRTFLMLQDWYQNHELYHKIGYLIASGYLTLQQIFKFYKETKTKTAFRALLDKHICESIKIDGNYADMSYENKNDCTRISRLLLLFNVESVRQNGEQTQWFPFDKFKSGEKGEVSWTLEHIHAQQSEGLNTQEVQKEWLKLHIDSVRAVSDDALAEDMEKALSKQELRGETFQSLQQRVFECLSKDKNVEYLHSIANLALLSWEDNAALNNSTFDVKRNRIVEMDKKGCYIPFCTKMVFLKYYTPSQENQLHFWGAADRKAYIKALNRVLEPYLLESYITVPEEA